MTYLVNLGCISRNFSKDRQTLAFFWEQTHLLFTFLLLAKVCAVNKYDPPPEVVAVRDHMTHVVNSMSQPQRIFDRYL